MLLKDLLDVIDKDRESDERVIIFGEDSTVDSGFKLHSKQLKYIEHIPVKAIVALENYVIGVWLHDTEI